jgi:hypothetical protein
MFQLSSFGTKIFNNLIFDPEIEVSKARTAQSQKALKALLKSLEKEGIAPK